LVATRFPREPPSHSRERAPCVSRVDDDVCVSVDLVPEVLAPRPASALLPKPASTSWVVVPSKTHSSSDEDSLGSPPSRRTRPRFDSPVVSSRRTSRLPITQVSNTYAPGACPRGGDCRCEMKRRLHELSLEISTRHSANSSRFFRRALFAAPQSSSRGHG